MTIHDYSNKYKYSKMNLNFFGLDVVPEQFLYLGIQFKLEAVGELFCLFLHLPTLLFVFLFAIRLYFDASNLWLE